MAKSKRTRRAKNKIEGSSSEALIPAEPISEPAIAVQQLRVVRLARATLSTMDLEEAIDLIARERVYRAMLASLRNRLLAPPKTGDDAF